MGLYINNGWVVIKTTETVSSGDYIDPIIGSEPSYPATDVTVALDNFPGTVASGPNYRGLSAAAMKQKASYPSFDFTNIWTIDEGVDFPRFQLTAVDKRQFAIVIYDKSVPPGNPAEIQQEIRVGATRNYRVYDVSEYPFVADLTEQVYVEVGAIPGSALPLGKQCQIDERKYTIKFNDVGLVPIKLKYRGDTVDTTIDIYGPDSFLFLDDANSGYQKGVPHRFMVRAIYKDNYAEPLVPLNEFVVSDDTITIGPNYIRPLEAGDLTLTATRFGLSEVHTITVTPLQAPNVLEVDSTSATLYVLFNLGYGLETETFFKVRAFEDEARTIPIHEINTIDNKGHFRKTVDGGATWFKFAQSAVAPTGSDAEAFSAQLHVGPRREVFVDVGIAVGDTFTDSFAPEIAASPAPGIYNEEIVVKLGISEPGTIFYCLETGIPDILYEPKVGIPVSGSTNILVLAEDARGNVSEINTFEYIVDTEAPTVYADPEPGQYMNAVVVTLTASETEATIFYSLEDEEVTENSSTYTEPITLNEGTSTIRAMAIDRAGNIGEVVSFTYDVLGAIKGGSFDDPVIVNVEEGTPMVTMTHDQIDDVYFRYDGFIPEAEYTAQFVEVPEEQGGGSGIGVFSSTQEMVNSGWIMTPLTFTATSPSMYIVALRGTNHWDPVKLVITKS